MMPEFISAGLSDDMVGRLVIGIGDVPHKIVSVSGSSAIIRELTPWEMRRWRLARLVRPLVSAGRWVRRSFWRAETWVEDRLGLGGN